MKLLLRHLVALTESQVSSILPTDRVFIDPLKLGLHEASTEALKVLQLPPPTLFPQHLVNSQIFSWLLSF